MTKQGILLLAIVFAFCLNATAQSAISAREMLKSMTEKYEEKDGVDGFVFTKGSGLEFVKLALRREMGKEFIKGVNMIIIIDYSKANTQLVEQIRSQVETLSQDYEQQELPDSITKGVYLRNFSKMGENNEYISDMVILTEKDDVKTIIYFGGKIVGEPKSKSKSKSKSK